nr:hypothetical protein [Tanacetum cinerariifolium]
MERLAFCDYHNMIAILEKYEHNIDFHQIVDFVEAFHLRYALTINPTVYVSHIRQFWSTARIETTDEGTKILATVDGKPRTISESSIRRNLKLKDEAGISSLSDAELFKNLTLMGYNILPNQKFSFQKDEGSGTPTKPQHTPSPEAQQTSPTATSSPSLPPVTIATIPTQDEMALKITAQDLEISTLKAIIKHQEDRDGGDDDPSGEDATIKGMSLETGEEAGIERSTEKGIDDTEEMVNVLTFLHAASVLSSGVQVSVSPVAEVSTLLELMLSKRSKKNTKCVNAVNEELTAAKLNILSPLVLKKKEKDLRKKGLRLKQDSAKKMKTSEKVSEEELKMFMQLVLVKEVYVEALHALVKETLSIRPATSDKEKELWVELKRLYEPDVEDQL